MALYHLTVQIVDENGNVINGTASAIMAQYHEIVRVVDSNGKVIDSFGFSGTPALEVPTGAIPGVTYTLSAAPIANTLMLIKNGVIQNPGVGNDYTISGVTITMLASTIVNDSLLAYYWH